MPTSDSTIHHVYRIVCLITKKCYVGQTNDLKLRKRMHFSALTRNKHENRHLQFAWNKYGRRAFLFEILERDIPTEQIDGREQYWIAHFDSFNNGFNRTPGGLSGTGVYVSKKCVWGGVEYPSILAAAIANDIKPSTLYARIRKGYACDSDMPGQGSSINTHVKCVWNGIEYESISEAARYIGISPTTLQYRLERGYTRNDDMPGITKKIVWNGVSYLSIKAAARHLVLVGL